MKRPGLHSNEETEDSYGPLVKIPFSDIEKHSA